VLLINDLSYIGMFWFLAVEDQEAYLLRHLPPHHQALESIHPSHSLADLGVFRFNLDDYCMDI
jgi:hypothetical protein